MSALNDCPHPTCGLKKPRTMYACKTHWFSLPEKIRKAIWAGYRGAPYSDWNKANEDALTYWKENGR